MSHADVIDLLFRLIELVVLLYLSQPCCGDPHHHGQR